MAGATVARRAGYDWPPEPRPGVSAVSAAAYRGLLAEPALRRLAIADACARLPQGMVSLTVLLVAAEHASMAVAGLVLAGYTLGQAVTGPVRGRLADRYGLTKVAACCSLGYALALLALLAGAMSGAPTGMLTASATVAGLVNPPLSPGLRSLWSAHADARLAQAAFALDAAVFDLAYITGPVLAGVLATGLAPAAALGLMLALTGAAVVIIGRRLRDTSAGHPPERRSRPRFPLRSARLGRLLLTGALANAALSATEVALTGYVRHHHAFWAAGPLLAEISAGSILGSLLLGARASPGRLPRLLACYAGGLAVLTAAGLDAPLLAVAAPLAGFFLGPVLATLFSGAAAAAPSGSGTETQAWLNSIMNGGAAAGAAMTGALLAGPGASRPILALALPFALALGAAASAAIGRPRTLTGHAPGPFGRNEPSEEVRRELVDTAARARRGGRQPVVPGRRRRSADR
jgi:predicted MFS family arabinose efflux permease